jgi:hypothetical protein
MNHVTPTNFKELSDTKPDMLNKNLKMIKNINYDTISGEKCCVEN